LCDINSVDAAKRGFFMYGYECYGELLSDGHLKIPDEVIKKYIKIQKLNWLS
jgi:hypothetical protein